MKLHVAGLLQDPVGSTRSHEIEEEIADIDDRIVPAGSVKGSAKLTRTNAGIMVDANLDAAIRLTCGRCLGEFVAPLKVCFREQFLPVIDIGSGLPLPEPDDGSTLQIDENHILDLSEAFRQYALLTLPIAPTCSPTCAGLCPTCGKNLNEGPCKCPPRARDQRWRALATLLNGEGGTFGSGPEKPSSRKKRRQAAR